ncbi:MAG: 3-hydroxyacyl-CoA dehydrogenase family protein, partial [Thermodesulfobacteriota bacterium]
GCKSGSGFYLYDKSNKGQINPQIINMLKLDAPDRLTFENKEIVNRLILPMINEAVYCLDEDVISEPHAVDTAMIFGAGFPPYTGGLIRLGDTIGARQIVDRLDEFTDKFGVRFAPAGLLRKMAKLDAGFYNT